ncbi:MAG: hypothetical protein WCK37_00275 [Candidatus Falkowbacteria bacterium]
MVNKALLKEFQIILKEEFSLELTPAQTSKLGNGIVGYFDVLNRVNKAIKSERLEKIK